MRGIKLVQCKLNISNTCFGTWNTVQSHVIHKFLTSASGLVRSRSETWDTVTTEPSNTVRTSSIATYTHKGRTFIDICRKIQKNAGRNIEQYQEHYVWSWDTHARDFDFWSSAVVGRPSSTFYKVLYNWQKKPTTTIIGRQKSFKKILLNWRKPENKSLARQRNTRGIIINNKDQGWLRMGKINKDNKRKDLGSTF